MKGQLLLLLSLIALSSAASITSKRVGELLRSLEAMAEIEDLKALAEVADNHKVSSDREVVQRLIQMLELNQNEMADTASQTCSQMCTSGAQYPGHRYDGGYITGTAPLCEGSCDDCGPEYTCFGPAKGLSDYGAGCAWGFEGRKFCCCHKA